MKLNTSLNFDGRCREAFEFYAAVLGGEIKAMMTFAELPEMEGALGDAGERIAHAWLQVGDQSLMGSDAPTPAFVEPVGGFSVALHADTAADARRLFDGLAEGGTVVMPVSQTSWSPAFGMLKDQFGVPWMVNAVAAAPT
jgi:PhnB protein